MISIENLSKTFKVYKRRIGVLYDVFGFAKEGVDYDKVNSLKDINLVVPNGKVHGIIGMNGAGKSTLLKILTGVIVPSSGSFTVSGRVAALLELGTGFHGDLTGRENVYMNATLMGLSRKDIDQKIAAIIDFAELGEFFDRPVRIYSSGMYVRLAFAFAVEVDPDILIIDEALSVGDAYFQQKCLVKMQEFKKKGVTILFVSHDLSAVRLLCETVTVLSKGRVVYEGNPMQALDTYNALLAEQNEMQLHVAKQAAEQSVEALTSFESGTKRVRIESVRLVDLKGTSCTAFVAGDNIAIEIEIVCQQDVAQEFNCGFLIRDRLGYDIFGTSALFLGRPLPPMRTGERRTLKFGMDMNLGAGDYTLTIALHPGASHSTDNYHWLERALLFKVLAHSKFQSIGVSWLQPKVQIE